MKKFLLMCFLLAFAVSAWAQERTITGRVTSTEDGSPLPGVNVVLKGTTTGVVTDADGNYRLTVTGSGGSLIFSFIGLQTTEVPIGERTTIDVSLALDVTQLSEVVVTAQGITQERRALGYAVTSVNSSSIENRPETDVARLLSGKIPGVNITSMSGVSGTGTNINIRGYNSISGNTQPLFIVDGVPFNTNTNAQGDFLGGNQAVSSRFLDLDPNNIESISSLRGLAASVLYGQQGRNGVIIITTKNASKKKEQFQLTANQSYFVNEIASLPDYQNSYGNGFAQNYGPFFSNWGPSFDEVDEVPHPYGGFSDPTLAAEFPEYQGLMIPYRAYDNTRFWNKGHISTTSLNISGGNDKVNYNTSFGYNDETGFTPGNTLKKINFGLGLNAQLTEKFSINSSFNYASTDMKTPPISGGNGSGADFAAGDAPTIFGDVFYTPRSVDLMGWPFETSDNRSVFYRGGNDIENPRWTAKYSRQTDDVRRFFGSTGFNYTINDIFSANYRIGLDTYREFMQYIVNRGGVARPNGLYRTTSVSNTIWNHDFRINAQKSFSQDLNMTASVGLNARLDSYEQDGQESTNQVVFGFINHSNFIFHSSVNSFTGQDIQFKQEQNYYGVYGTVTLDYKEYLYVNLQGRNDWSSTVEKENRSIFYPSASVSFLPTTAFDLQSDVVDDIKLRVGYGTSAGFPTPYNTRSVLSSTARAFQDSEGRILTTNSISDVLGNPNLKPELQEEIEFGIEGKLFKGRLIVDVTRYMRNTKDLITTAPLDPSTGYSLTTVNIGKISNKGWEVNLRGTPVQLANGLTWDLNFNFYKYKSVVEDLGAGLEQVLVAGYTNLGNFAIEGKPFNAIQGTYVVRDDEGRRLVGSDGNYIVSDDIKIIGDPNPDFTSSLISNLSYKGFTLTTQLDFRKGGDIYSTTIATLYGRGVTKDTDYDRNKTFILDGYKEDGTPNDIQITSSNYGFDNVGFGANELQVYDGTTIRLQEVSLSYALPKTILSKTPFKAVSLTFSGFNLWYNAINTPKHVNFDTNVLSTGVGNGLGFDFMTGPSSRRYGANLRITL